MGSCAVGQYAGAQDAGNGDREVDARVWYGLVNTPGL